MSGYIVPFKEGGKMMFKKGIKDGKEVLVFQGTIDDFYQDKNIKIVPTGGEVTEEEIQEGLDGK